MADKASLILIGALSYYINKIELRSKEGVLSNTRLLTSVLLCHPLTFPNVKTASPLAFNDLFYYIMFCVICQ